MAITGTISGVIEITDNIAGSVQLQRLLNFAFTGVVSSYANTATYGVAPTVVTLPVSPVQFVYIKNSSTVNTATITWTPTGGASNPVVTLEPGGVIMFCEPITGAGITALTIAASGAGTPVEWIFVG